VSETTHSHRVAFAVDTWKIFCTVNVTQIRKACNMKALPIN